LGHYAGLDAKADPLVKLSDEQVEYQYGPTAPPVRRRRRKRWLIGAWRAGSTARPIATGPWASMRS